MFTLNTYEREIKDFATLKNLDNETAVHQFVYNLVTLRPTIEGFDSEINFRVIGQQWNALGSDARNEQVANLITLLNKPKTTRR